MKKNNVFIQETFSVRVSGGHQSYCFSDDDAENVAWEDQEISQKFAEIIHSQGRGENENSTMIQMLTIRKYSLDSGVCESKVLKRSLKKW